MFLISINGGTCNCLLELDGASEVLSDMTRHWGTCKWMSQNIADQVQLLADFGCDPCI